MVVVAGAAKGQVRRETMMSVDSNRAWSFVHVSIMLRVHTGAVTESVSLAKR